MTDQQIITVYNWKGGVAKSTIAVHLAHYFAEKGEEWCLWDADRQQDAIAWITEHEWDGSPPDIFVSEDGKADIPVTIRQGTALSQDRLIIDTPPEESVVEDLLSVVNFTDGDFVICPANGRLAIRGAVAVAEKVADTGCRVLLVPTLTDPRDANAPDEIEALRQLAEMDEVNATLFELAIPRNDSYMRRAEKEGIPIWEIPHSEKTHTCKALRAFCAWVAQGAPPDNNPPTDSAPGASGPISDDIKDRLWDE